MRKSDMVEKIAGTFNTSKAEAERIINFYANMINEELVNNGESTIHGVGNLKVKVRAARTARNPSTGETVNVPSKKAVTFKATSSLKEKVQ